MAGLTTILGAIMLAPVFLYYPGVFADAANLSWRGWLAAGTMSVLAIFVGYILWFRGLRRLQPSQVTVYVYLVPFFASSCCSAKQSRRLCSAAQPSSPASSSPTPVAARRLSQVS